MRHIDDIKKDWSQELMPEGNRLINLSTGEEEKMQPIRKYYSCDVKDFSEKDKTFTAIASTESVDRDGDILSANGWKLKNYKKNPVFLWGHDAHSLPIGKSLNTWVEGSKLMFQPQFATDISPFAEIVWKMYKAKILRSFSVRFDPIEWEDIEQPEGKQIFFPPRKYIKQELLEISAVNIPSNTEAIKSPAMLDFVVKSYYAEHPQEFPEIDFSKQIWNGNDFTKEKICTGCADKKKEFSIELKNKYDKLDSLKKEKEIKLVEEKLDQEIVDLENELKAENDKKVNNKEIIELSKKINELQSGITDLVKK